MRHLLVARRRDYIDSFGIPIKSGMLYEFHPIKEDQIYAYLIPGKKPSEVESFWKSLRIFPNGGYISRYDLTPLDATSCRIIQPEKLLARIENVEEEVAKTRRVLQATKRWSRKMIEQEANLFGGQPLNHLLREENPANPASYLLIMEALKRANPGRFPEYSKGKK